MSWIAAQYFLNTDLRKEELEAQADLLCEAGYDEVYLHARTGLKTPYLSKQWFEALRIIIDKLKSHGVKFSIWDEDNYPSGTAGNRTINNYPELASQRLNYLTFDCKKGEKIREFFSEKGAFLKAFAVNSAGEITDISEYCGTLKSQWYPAHINLTAYSPYSQLALPHRRRRMNSTRMAIEYTPAEDCRVIAVEILREAVVYNTDILNREAIDHLIEYTHEEYKRVLGKETLKENCIASFLDEPSLEGYLPWTRCLPDEFRKDHNYDLMPHLAHLWFNITPGSAKIRNDYRSTLHRLLCQNYLGHLKKYLNDNGLISVGHLTRSEYLSIANCRWPNQLRCLQYLDIPCGDPLGEGIGKIGSLAHHLGLKTVASAARLANRRAGADAFAVGGDSISLRNLKFMADYHLAMGMTYFSIHGLNYTTEGESFDETPPSLFYQHSQWKHMKEFISYLKERCKTLSAPHVCKTGFLYPDITLKCLAPETPAPDEALHQTSDILLSHQRDFELIDSMTLSEQSVEDYAALRPFFIVAHSAQIIHSTAMFLEAYVKAGGTLIVTGCVPRIIDLPGVPEWEFSKAYYTDDYLSLIPAPELKGEGCEAILIRQFETASGIDTFLFNRSDLPFDGTFEGKPLSLEPGGSILASELELCSNAADLPLPDSWTLQFEGLNSVPLTFWNYNGGTAELFSRAKSDEHSFAEAAEFHSGFLASAGFKVFLTVEESMLKKGTFSVNGTPVPSGNFVKAGFRDCRHLECEITDLLNTGRSPLMNKITFTGDQLFENAPYLRGVFAANVPPGGENYPVLTAAAAEFSFCGKADFREFGYRTYSGAANCNSMIQVPETGTYRIRFAEVYDSARLMINGKDLGICIAPPYLWEVDLEQGEHSISVEICNNSGNRDRNLGLPAGIKIRHSAVGQ